MSNNPKILIVEDEGRIARFMAAVLKANSYDVITALNGTEALQMLGSYCPDIMILDLGLPDMDGVDIIKKARTWTQLPIIVVSARTNELDKVAALDAGADDYVTKPFGTNELLARIRTALRHTFINTGTGAVSPGGILKIKNLTIDYNKHQVFINGENAHLTQNEYKIVSLLGIHSGKVLTYDFILKELWGPAASGSNQVLRVHMANIRRKIDQNPAEPEYIFTEVGVGYRMADAE